MNSLKPLTIAAFGIILAGGLAHGWATHRWLTNDAVISAAAQLKHIPATVGDWISEEQSLSEAELTVGGIADYVKREYTNTITGARVHLLLMVGEAGPISLHPPTVCFSGQGYQIVGRQSRCTVNGHESASLSPQHELHQADFGNSAVSDPTLTRLYWAWTTDGTWHAPDNPRMQYAGKSALYKLYVSELWVPHGNRSDTGVAKLFLEEMLPEIGRALTVRVTKHD